ncbi:MAG: Ku protein [Deltaproteobacteria bacterium]|nr:Ku protein [Deltaproteobacteria bacterium]
MAARSIGSATISFGLVSIPTRLYVATHSERIAFNMLHEVCGTRIKQQLYCPHCARVVERGETVKGYEFEKGRFVTFTGPEIAALEAEANHAIDIQEFVPLASVDPIYFENVHYLGPDKGAEKAYHLLAEAMRATEKVALAQFTSHGKEQLVLIRPYQDGLALHSMYYAEEVRAFDDVETGGDLKIRQGEAELARKLIDQLSTKAFHPEQYEDTYRDRVKAAVDRKVAGEKVRTPEASPARARVIDLMQALKESLAERGSKGEERSHAAAMRAPAGKRRPAASARRRVDAKPERRAHKK